MVTQSILTIDKSESLLSHFDPERTVAVGTHVAPVAPQQPDVDLNQSEKEMLSSLPARGSRRKGNPEGGSRKGSSRGHLLRAQAEQSAEQPAFVNPAVQAELDNDMELTPPPKSRRKRRGKTRRTLFIAERIVDKIVENVAEMESTGFGEALTKATDEVRQEIVEDVQAEIDEVRQEIGEEVQAEIAEDAIEEMKAATKQAMEEAVAVTAEFGSGGKPMSDDESEPTAEDSVFGAEAVMAAAGKGKEEKQPASKDKRKRKRSSKGKGKSKKNKKARKERAVEENKESKAEEADVEAEPAVVVALPKPKRHQGNRQMRGLSPEFLRKTINKPAVHKLKQLGSIARWEKQCATLTRMLVYSVTSTYLAAASRVMQYTNRKKLQSRTIIHAAESNGQRLYTTSDES